MSPEDDGFDLDNMPDEGQSGNFAHLSLEEAEEHMEVVPDEKMDALDAEVANLIATEKNKKKLYAKIINSLESIGLGVIKIADIVV